MKRLKPGNLCTIGNSVYRAVRKKGDSYFLDCSGCALNSPMSCPNIAFTNCKNKTPLNCEQDGLIFVRVC